MPFFFKTNRKLRKQLRDTELKRRQLEAVSVEEWWNSLSASDRESRLERASTFTRFWLSKSSFRRSVTTATVGTGFLLFVGVLLHSTSGHGISPLSGAVVAAFSITAFLVVFIELNGVETRLKSGLRETVDPVSFRIIRSLKRDDNREKPQ